MGTAELTVPAAGTAEAPRTVHVEHCMGTVFTLDLRDPGRWDAAIAAAVGWLHHVDAVFSTYSDGSDISRMRRGELRLADADPAVEQVLELCAQAQARTGGAFTAMPQGRLDPTGLVKGWAVERASRLLTEHGAVNHAVNGGGDLQLAGSAGPDRPWVVGISDPADRRRIADTVTGRDLAVATSGTAERGKHILDPLTGRPATGLASATVVGPSLTFADAYATAAFVLGRHALRWITEIDGYEALLIGSDGTVSTSRGWRTEW
ncbi:FAD:protein FMN transferase [Jatrophihabitans sp.]|uniref:FAD:protein FMN transferase n=1 Tax=Jatrophihabitans sp. TaxID=1932789 RepID=UPI002BFAABF5|nr:FAD:protein FMN transferase [Jatrophihabitans sp.]